MPDPSLSITLTLFCAGILAGITNVLAGGGTFFTFPVFLATGISPVVASASNAVAVWPGHALAVISYRRELSTHAHLVRGSIIVALVGGIVGALLLSIIGNHAFTKLIPILIVFATLLFAFGTRIRDYLKTRAPATDFARPNLLTRLVEFMLAVYGGFFGAGLGVMLMAGLLILGVKDMQTNNALKNLLATVVTTVSVTVLIVSGLVSWAHAIPALVGSFLGALAGGKIARRMPDIWLRRIVITVGFTLSIYYAIRFYGPSATS